jgi:hypothetical protein
MSLLLLQMMGSSLGVLMRMTRRRRRRMTRMMRKSFNTPSAKRKTTRRGNVIVLQEYPASIHNVLIVDRGFPCRHQIHRTVQFHGTSPCILSDSLVSQTFGNQLWRENQFRHRSQRIREICHPDCLDSVSRRESKRHKSRHKSQKSHQRRRKVPTKSLL